MRPRPDSSRAFPAAFPGGSHMPATVQPQYAAQSPNSPAIPSRKRKMARPCRLSPYIMSRRAVISRQPTGPHSVSMRHPPHRRLLPNLDVTMETVGGLCMRHYHRRRTHRHGQRAIGAKAISPPAVIVIRARLSHLRDLRMPAEGHYVAKVDQVRAIATATSRHRNARNQHPGKATLGS